MNITYSKGFNYAIVARLLGGLLLVESIFFLFCGAVALYYRESTSLYFGLAFAVAVFLGTTGMLVGKNASTFVSKREGSVVVMITWIIFSFIGMQPYWLSGSIPSFTDAFFETMSGFTTTGASILQDIEVLPKSLLFWRSITHWIGGLGIIVITMAVLPIFGFNGSQIYSAEVTGLSKEKIHPKISGTAKRLLSIYLGLTLAGATALYFAGMSLFDAVCHSLATVSTGGFSTKNASINFWNSPSVEWIIIVLMISSGINFSVYYYLLKGKFRKFFKDEELRTYLIIIMVATIIITLNRMDITNLSLWSIGDTLRGCMFTVSSLMTTTGFYAVDYSDWHSVAFLLLLLTFIGGSAGSTSGGVKVIRVLLVFKYCYYEFKRIVHPNAVFPVRYNGQSIKEDIITRLLAFLLLYVILSLVGSAILCFSGLGFEESISAMVSCLGNVGPGLGKLGPIDNYSVLSDFAKWFISFAMLVGRLEFFTVLLIFTPAFWKR
ncbi:MAG: TrkH family potassium uptake protein [Prevotellaceae bacterium]|jgi:trk system potassium uptake protein TrkH|nr:TrkH family potassium uptake protein [Prevotellaceae bacterium]